MAKSEQLQDKVTLDLTLRPELPTDYKTFKSTAQALQVIDDESFSIAHEMITRQVNWDAGVEKFFAKAAKAAYDAWKSIVGKGDDEREPGLIVQLKEPMAVRDILQPRMKAYRKKQEDARRAEELRLQREAEAARHIAEQEARAIQEAADAEAARLRQEGQISAARATQIEAARQAVVAVETAQILADVGVVLPAAPKPAGLGESMAWKGVCDDIIETCRAIGAREIPLTYTLPKRGGGEEEIPIVEISQRVIDWLAKRNGRADIGVPGCRGDRGLTLRFSKDAAPVQSLSRLDKEDGVDW